MDAIFREQIGKELAVYPDDLLMYSPRHIELLRIMDRTLGQLTNACLKCKRHKSQVFPESIHYVGYIIQEGKITADRSKLDKIREWPNPKIGNELA